MSLKQVFHQYFKVGAAVPAKMLDSAAARQALISQYDSMTCENEMKPELVLDYEKNVSNPEKYGVSPKRYIIQLKINYACDLLKSGDYSVKETAEMSGFEDLYFFSRQFKEYMGMSPAKYKNNPPK